ncbi:MAG: response regulator transcription factor [Actinomycetota bacterium]|nr:response regulator transcription factor [Actinomycetota bacterium]
MTDREQAAEGSPAEPTRVVVVDDQELFRRGLTMLIGTLDGIELVGEAGNGQEAVEVVLRTDPEVVLLDVRMPGRSGIETCAELKALMPSVRIVMLTASDEESDLYDAVRSGASGYLLKSSSIDDVAEAVRLVADGQSLITPSMAVKLLDEFKQLANAGPAVAGVPRLTDRELQVLAEMARGSSNREIARVLFITENTVKNHVRNILEKLQLHSRMEAVMYAMREKLLDVP